MDARRRRTRRDDAGFTLVEILAVLAILSLLMGLAIYAFSRPREFALGAKTRATMTELEGAIARYQSKFGSPPPDSLAKLKIRADNDANEGAEALYAALHHKDFPEGASIRDENLGNGDDDSTATAYHRDGSTFLLEVKDGWGNPIAYITPQSYARQFRYLLPEPDDPSDPEQIVSAQKSSVTGVWANPDTFQLISAGSDKKFGTDDDVTNFKK